MTKELDVQPLEGELAGIVYDSNNSGGSWWLSDEDWYALERAGWEVKWKKDDPYYSQGSFMGLDSDGRWLGALATEAVRYGLSMEDAIAEWEDVTGLDADDEGCNCCGSPHYFDTTF